MDLQGQCKFGSAVSRVPLAPPHWVRSRSLAAPRGEVAIAAGEKNMMRAVLLYLLHMV